MRKSKQKKKDKVADVGLAQWAVNVYFSVVTVTKKNMALIVTASMTLKRKGEKHHSLLVSA